MDFLIFIACVTCFDILNTVLRHVVPYKRLLRYVLMMIYQFTKWVEMAAIPEQSALTIAEKFVVHFVVTFGCPLEVHTDQGRNLDGNLFKSLCTILEVAKTRTTPLEGGSNPRSTAIETSMLTITPPM
jgi:hypothetical protein